MKNRPYRHLLSFSFMMILAVIGTLYFQENVQAESEYTDFYFVRHAQTLANATGEYTKVNEKTISVKGQKQIKRLVYKLNKYHGPFDHIIVSPTVRTRETALAYLKEEPYRSAELWPEVSECCWHKKKNDVEPDYRNRGRIGLRSEHKPYYHFRSMAKKDMSWFSTSSYQDGQAQIKKAITMLKARYGHSGKKILIVTHYYAGLKMINTLLGDRYKQLHVFKNAKVTHLRQDKDGSFRLILLNNHQPKNKLKND
ncbi:MAG: histidine phosphatase family protein [Mariprofundaceae bacterium]|nr:histidine phosphatase family protein [Mariprofundaceae bacterium]